MIKRLIFDFDNTIMMWETRFYEYSLSNTFKALGMPFSNDIIGQFENAVESYEKYFDVYDKDEYLNYLNEKLNLNLPSDFIDTWLKYLGDCYSEPNKELIDTLEYLKNKYDLVLLSNWFSTSQINRLKGAGLDKYFSKQIYTDKVKNKPNKEAFLEAIKPYNIDECIMIGDSIEKDIKGAESIGMKTILINNEKKVEDLSRIL